MKTTNLLWLFSFSLLGVCTIILAGTNALGIGLPDFVIRGTGLLDLAALAVFAYAAVKKLGDKK